MFPFSHIASVVTHLLEAVDALIGDFLTESQVFADISKGTVLNTERSGELLGISIYTAQVFSTKSLFMLIHLHFD